jgi:hypothetical protein
VDVDNVTTSVTVTDTNFHHLAVTKSGTIVAFYIDGVPYAVPTYNSTFTFSTPAAVGVVGGRSDGGFLGWIDEVSIYNRPLGPQEITAVYNAGAAGKCFGPTPPSINVQPQNVMATIGTNVAFYVGAAGSMPLFYQWEFHGTNLVGATNYNLAVTNVQISSLGGYQVTVTNAFGSVTSSVAMLSLPPVINSQPQSLTVSPGSPAEFVVGVSGTPPFFFQWQHGGTNLPAAFSYSLIITNSQLTDAGVYTVIVTNSLGSVTSAPAMLTLNLPPTITNQPAAQAVPAGSNPFFIVGATASAPLTYQWQFGGTNLPNATGVTLFLSNVQSSNAGPYSVLVSTAFGTTPSSNALLIVTNPICTTAPTGLIGWWQAEGSPANSVSGAFGTLIGHTNYVPGKVGQAFSFSGSGDAVLIGTQAMFQLQDFSIEAWVKRGSTNKASQTSGGGELLGYGSGGYLLGLQDDGHPFLSRVDSSQVTAGVQIVDTNWHHLAVTKSSSTVYFYLDSTPNLVSPYSPGFVFSSSVAIGARGDNYHNSFLGLIDEIAVFNRALSSNEVQAIYYATSQGMCPLPLSWLTQPTNQTVPLGANVTFSASVAGGSRPVGYQWTLNGAGLNGVTNSALVLSNVNYFQAGSYSITATNAAGSISSSNAVLTLLSPPLLTNGSFEAGNAGGWILSDIAFPLTPLAVRGAGFNSGFGFFSTAPTDGNYCLAGGFDGDGPGRIRAAVDVVLPPSPVTLTFNYRFAWDMQNYSGSTLPRTFGVTIEPFGGGTGLLTNIFLTALPGTANYDTGNQTGPVNLSPFSGHAIRISFDATIPESFTGPGFFQLDNVVLSYLPLPPFLIASSGTNIVLSWPVSFSNFTALVTTNLAPPVLWTPTPTNLVVPGPTNLSLTLPISYQNNFFRLKSY